MGESEEALLCFCVLSGYTQGKYGLCHPTVSTFLCRISLDAGIFIIHFQLKSNYSLFIVCSNGSSFEYW